MKFNMPHGFCKPAGAGRPGCLRLPERLEHVHVAAAGNQLRPVPHGADWREHALRHRCLGAGADDGGRGDCHGALPVHFRVHAKAAD